MVARQIESKTIFSAVDRVSPVTAKIAKGMTPLANRLSKVGKSLQDFGGSAVIKSGVGLTAMFVGLAKPAMAFEKSMANVFKVFDPTKINISEKTFSKTVRNMSSGMGIMATQMADIFENMPLPEILNIDDMSIADKYKGIMEMAEMTAMSLTTMGLEAGDAGEKMKSMFNVLGGKDINKVLQTMNAVNEMGNQFGVTPERTLEFLTRQGGLGLGQTAGLSNLDTTAIGGTMLGFGATPETSKTSFQKMINVGQAYTSATKKQQIAFKKLGTTAEKFAQIWQNSPTDAIIDILERAKGLEDIEITPVFKELFGVEGSVNIKTFMLNVDAFSKKLKLMNDEQAIHNSVQREFAKLSKTSSFAVDRMKSSLNNMGIVLGDALLPHITKISDKISEWTKKYEKLSPETKEAIGDFVVLTGGLLTLGVAIGGVSYALGGLALAMGVASKASKAMGDMNLLGMAGFGGSKGKKGLSIPPIVPMPKVKGISNVSFLGGFEGKAANTNKLGFFKKLTGLVLQGAGAMALLGINFKKVFSVLSVGTRVFSRFVLPVAILVGLADGIYRKWDKLVYMFDKIGTSLNVLADSFGLGGAGGKIKTGAENISNWLGDIIGNTLVGLLAMVDKLIYGLSFSANLIKTKSWSGATALTDAYQDQYSMTPKQKKDQENKSTVAALNKMPWGNSDVGTFRKEVANQSEIRVVVEDKRIIVKRGDTIIKETKTANGNTSPVLRRGYNANKGSYSQ